MGEITYKLDELAEASGVSARTVRYYVQRGLVPAPQFRGRDTAYGEEHLLRLRAIKRLQERFLPLDAIAAELDGLTDRELRAVAEGKAPLARAAPPQSPSPKEPTAARSPEGALTGASPSMLAVFAQIEKLASANSSVLITGETGTGKELLAREIHRRSPRASKPFLRVDCEAIPESLLESELFGHVRGSFTGVVQNKPGLLQKADGGTIFLERLEALPLSAQARLYRTLRDGAVRPTGGEKDTKVDVRVLASSTRDLGEEVKAQRFRQDFFLKIGALHVHLPPLRERGEDVLILAEALLTRLSEGKPSAPVAFSPSAIDALRSHSWPGNVSELAARVERAVTLCEGPLMNEADLELVAPHPSADTGAERGPHQGRRTAPAHTASSWQRWELAPGLELQLSSNASDEVARLARELVVRAAGRKPWRK